MEFDNVTNLDRKSGGSPTIVCAIATRRAGEESGSLLRGVVRLSRPGKAMEKKSLSSHVSWGERGAPVRLCRGMCAKVLNTDHHDN